MLRQLWIVVQSKHSLAQSHQCVDQFVLDVHGFDLVFNELCC